MGKNDAADPVHVKGNGLVNIMGIVLAFGFAFGGLFLVQNMLMEEKGNLLRSGGMIEISGQDLEEEAVKIVETDAEKLLLTEEELIQAVENMQNLEHDAYPHEPLPGQMSMVEAIECGRKWLEDFLMPHLGAEDYIPQGYMITSYLVAPWEDDEDGMEKQLRSYWMVALAGEDVEVELVLNAVTGQMLGTSVECHFPAECLEKEKLAELLEDYVESFGLEGECGVVCSEKYAEQTGALLMLQSVGNGEVFANMRTSGVVVTATGIQEYRDTFYVRLWLGTEVF